MYILDKIKKMWYNHIRGCKLFVVGSLNWTFYVSTDEEKKNSPNCLNLENTYTLSVIFEFFFHKDENLAL